ncbi:MAG: GIY-YIG nuclease family protein [Candidatus Omnitrophota bacterium]
MYYVYVLKKAKTGKPYYGYSNDLKRRLSEHKKGMRKLIYYEAYKAKSDARRREVGIKIPAMQSARLKQESRSR